MSEGGKASQWLRTGGYDAGIELLREGMQQGFRCPLFAVISAGQNSYTEGKLREAVGAMVEAGIDPAADIPESPSPDIYGGHKPKLYGAVDVHGFPPDLQELYERTRSNLKRMDQMRGQLMSIYYTGAGTEKKNPNKAMGFRICIAIDSLYKENRRNWDRLDYYREHGTYLPGTEPAKITVERLIELLELQPKALAYFRTRGANNSTTDKANEYRAVLDEIKRITSYGQT